MNNKILVVDDSPIYLNSVMRMLVKQNKLEVVGSCEDGDEVLPFMKYNKVDTILMDVLMKRMNGIRTTKLILRHFPEVRVIGISSNMDDFVKKEMLDAGATNCYDKNDDFHELLHIIHEQNSN